MKIELLEDFKHDDGSGFQVLRAGETRIVSDGLGKTLCDMGLAKDIDGTHPTAERDPNKVFAIKPENAKISEVAGEG